MDWIIHLDTDELMHPAGAREYSLRRLLSDVPSNVDMVIFPNYVSGLLSLTVFRISFQNLMNSFFWFQESSIERDDIKDPFSEVIYINIFPLLFY